MAERPPVHLVTCLHASLYLAPPGVAASDLCSQLLTCMIVHWRLLKGLNPAGKSVHFHTQAGLDTKQVLQWSAVLHPHEL